MALTEQSVARAGKRASAARKRHERNVCELAHTNFCFFARMLAQLDPRKEVRLGCLIHASQARYRISGELVD
jgi:hypothetical protein